MVEAFVTSSDHSALLGNSTGSICPQFCFYVHEEMCQGKHYPFQWSNLRGCPFALVVAIVLLLVEVAEKILLLLGLTINLRGARHEDELVHPMYHKT